MVAGLDAWDEGCYFRQEKNEFIINEPRLCKRLGVNELRFPPDFRDSNSNSNVGITIPFTIFPKWHYCRFCGSMEKLQPFGDPSRRCRGPKFPDNKRSCATKVDNKKPRLIPSRFISICQKGHIEDFPFLEWVHRGRNYGSDCEASLRYLGGRIGNALTSVVIECNNCDAKPRSMGGSFNLQSLDKIGHKCRGFRPWLGEDHVNSTYCGESLKVVQRGASNVFFPKIKTSIYLPSYTSNIKRKIVKTVDEKWETLTSGMDGNQFDRTRFEIVADFYEVDVNELLEAAKEKLDNETVNMVEQIETEEEYRSVEYEKIISGQGSDNQDFYVTNLPSTDYQDPIRNNFLSISLIHKLRETRAFYGFTRWLPENGKNLQELKSELNKNGNPRWLPAVIVKGEGIFFQFDNEKIKKWSENSNIIERAQQINKQYNQFRAALGLIPRTINSRFILIHTFAHVLINRFCYICGYGSASLRERIYCDTEFEKPNDPMNGVLIYTSSGDSEGSLGGLVRQGKPGFLEEVVFEAIESSQWCSSDPICIDSKGQGPNSINLAACHNCSLLPETSCEEQNKLLDRGMLIGTDNDPNSGFFSSFIR
tara:strand:- start:171 stop:1949 length:1779 start_codon:yes stop_codon:yes gene_type:complete